MHSTVQVVKPHQSSSVHAPGAATQATTTVAAVPKFRIVATGIVVSIAAAAAAVGPVKWHLRDGLTGAGTPLASGTLSAPVQGKASEVLLDIAIPGSENTAMTLEFEAAAAAGSLEAVTLLYNLRRESN